MFTIGRDYEVKDINYYTVDSGEREEYKNCLIEIAQNRLNAVPVFHNKGLDRIETFLGDKEDLVKEANDWVGNNNDHFKILDNEVHQHVIDLSTVSGKVTVVLIGGYVDVSGNPDSLIIIPNNPLIRHQHYKHSKFLFFHPHRIDSLNISDLCFPEYI